MDYKEEQEIESRKRLNNVLRELPDICFDFFLSIAQTTSIKTRLGYAYDIRLFLNFLVQNIKCFENKNIIEINEEDLENVTYKDIELFLDYVSIYYKEGKTKLGKDIKIKHINNEKGKSRKLSTIKRFFSYLYKVSKIKANPAQLVDAPKIHQNNIIYLEQSEIENLLDEIENGTNLTEKQLAYHNLTKRRDYAIVCLLLGTGIRISECVGINIDDIDFSVCGIKIVRKGGNESIVYFGDEVYDALCSYLDEKETIDAKSGHEDALFLSLQKKRICARAVQKLVKKYARLVNPLKNISPHKLRSTYGTSLYEKTKDIYLVADALGHVDINTTKKHYVKIKEERRKEAAKYTKLRERECEE